MKVRPPVRKLDKWGDGTFGAPRSKKVNGKTKKYFHKGVDFACYPGSVVCAVKPGIVTKLGYPYPPDDPKRGHFRYVQVTDENDYNARYFYIYPMVKVGDKIERGDDLGASQTFQRLYPGIADHVHLEVVHFGNYINPMDYL